MLVEGNILENYLGYKGCGLIGPSLPEAPIRGDYLNLEKLIFWLECECSMLVWFYNSLLRASAQSFFIPISFRVYPSIFLLLLS